jgi:hypothetical protein
LLPPFKLANLSSELLYDLAQLVFQALLLIDDFALSPNDVVLVLLSVSWLKDKLLLSARNP